MKEAEAKNIRIATKYPGSVIEKIDEVIAQGGSETRSSFVRRIVTNYFDDRVAEIPPAPPSEATQALMQNPLAVLFFVHCAELFTSLAGILDRGDLGEQRRIFEKALENGSPNELKGQIMELFEEYERRENAKKGVFEISGDRFLEVLAPYAGRKLQPREMIELISQLSGLPLEEVAKQFLEDRESDPSAWTGITMTLTPLEGSEEQAELLCQVLERASTPGKKVKDAAEVAEVAKE